MRRTRSRACRYRSNSPTSSSASRGGCAGSSPGPPWAGSRSSTSRSCRRSPSASTMGRAGRTGPFRVGSRATFTPSMFVSWRMIFRFSPMASGSTSRSSTRGTSAYSLAPAGRPRGPWSSAAPASIIASRACCPATQSGFGPLARRWRPSRSRAAPGNTTAPSLSPKARRRPRFAAAEPPPVPVRSRVPGLLYYLGAFFVSAAAAAGLIQGRRHGRKRGRRVVEEAYVAGIQYFSAALALVVSGALLIDQLLFLA